MCVAALYFISSSKEMYIQVDLDILVHKYARESFKSKFVGPVNKYMAQ